MELRPPDVLLLVPNTTSPKERGGGHLATPRLFGPKNEMIEFPIDWVGRIAFGPPMEAAFGQWPVSFSPSTLLRIRPWRLYSLFELFLTTRQGQSGQQKKGRCQ